MPVLRIVNLTLVALIVVAAAFTYKTKHETEDTLRTIGSLERQIRLEEDTIDILEADWSLLTQPQRVQLLTEKYQDELTLQPFDPSQSSTIDEIPHKQFSPDTADEGLAEAQSLIGSDPVNTGSVKP